MADPDGAPGPPRAGEEPAGRLAELAGDPWVAPVEPPEADPCGAPAGDSRLGAVAAASVAAARPAAPRRRSPATPARPFPIALIVPIEPAELLEPPVGGAALPELVGTVSKY
jgi:hypothetical protein